MNAIRAGMRRETAFSDRADAGRRLAALLAPRRSEPSIVYALPRGGVPVGAEVARVLDAPLDVVVARKVGHPESSEYAIGAVSEDGVVVRNEKEWDAVDLEWLKEEVDRKLQEARRRADLYRGGRPRETAEGRTAIVVDDGVATGYTLKAALRTVRAWRPARLVAAVPVGPFGALQELESEANEVVSVLRPAVFRGAVGAYYMDFTQVEDAEVQVALRKAMAR